METQEAKHPGKISILRTIKKQGAGRWVGGWWGGGGVFVIHTTPNLKRLAGCHVYNSAYTAAFFLAHNLCVCVGFVCLSVS